MSDVLDVLAAVLVLGGAVLALAAAVGVVRFPDTLSRMHAATKPQVLGMLLTLLGAGIALRGNVDIWMLLLAGLFQLITAPVVAQRVAQVAYQERCLRQDLLDADELAAARSAPPASGGRDTGSDGRRHRHDAVGDRDNAYPEGRELA